MTTHGTTVLMYEEKSGLDEEALDLEYVMQSEFRDNIMTFKIEVRNKDACICKLARQAI